MEKKMILDGEISLVEASCQRKEGLRELELEEDKE